MSFYAIGGHGICRNLSVFRVRQQIYRHICVVTVPTILQEMREDNAEYELVR